MLLPVTVHGRVSDIWRSYFTQALLPLANAVPVFAPAWVEQVRVDSEFWARVRGGADKDGSGELSLISCTSCFAWMGAPGPIVCLSRDENPVFCRPCEHFSSTVSCLYIFASPKSYFFQVRNPHDYLGDFQAELPLYEQAGALVEFLLRHTQAEAMSNSGGLTWSRVEDLAVTMYEYGIVDEKDVVLAQVGLRWLIAFLGHSPAIMSMYLCMAIRSSSRTAIMDTHAPDTDARSSCLEAPTH